MIFLYERHGFGGVNVGTHAFKYLAVTQGADLGGLC